MRAHSHWTLEPDAGAAQALPDSDAGPAAAGAIPALTAFLWSSQRNGLIVGMSTMTIAERLLELKQSGQPFVLHLNDDRALRIRAGDYISLNPSGKGTNVTVYGDGEDEELFIPVFATSGVSVE